MASPPWSIWSARVATRMPARWWRSSCMCSQRRSLRAAASSRLWTTQQGLPDSSRCSSALLLLRNQLSHALECRAQALLKNTADRKILTKLLDQDEDRRCIAVGPLAPCLALRTKLVRACHPTNGRLLLSHLLPFEPGPGPTSVCFGRTRMGSTWCRSCPKGRCGFVEALQSSVC